VFFSRAFVGGLPALPEVPVLAAEPLDAAAGGFGLLAITKVTDFFNYL